MRQSLQLWFKRYFDMMWELRPWWFNAFIATPIALAALAFLPIGYFLYPPYRRFIDGMCAALEDNYESIREAHKLDPVARQIVENRSDLVSTNSGI